ncbi:tetratricopeptide repeat protein [Saccharothrix luteola]|uniref:tetratricopeptide repeat protein n=1 Tax=Saccharothrix luteola TaxID=2893018 RepID=UPI001E55CB03|nr:tetratricopeptide repeat protein [Saccharothrix luteola]MCC8244589.1 tetratricopeptide repeat protein [Saccharothrix luteola]
MAGIQRAEATFGGTVEQALRDINHTTNHYYGDRPTPITPGTSVAPPLGRLTHKVRGRSELVAALTDDVGGSIAVLAAGGGFGKTTVALDVARTLPRVWWVDASSRDSLLAGLAEVALQAGADSHEVREAWAGRGGSAIELLWRNLDHQSEPWALVFDNADDPDVLAATNHRVADGNGWLRTPKPTGSILVTSRTGTGWPTAARVHQVRQLDPDDGAQVLLDLVDAGDRRDAAALARRLGGLPLALRLAGRYLAVAQDAPALPGLEPPTTFMAYLERWDERFTELTEGESASPRESLSRTWEMSMDLLAERGQPQTRQLLRLISTFAEAPVPTFALDAAVMAASELLRGLTAHQLSLLLRALQDVGLLDVVESSVVVHPVIRDANRHQPDFEQNRQAYADLVARLLRDATKEHWGRDPEAWPRWRSVVPHLDVLGEIDDPELEEATATVLYHGAEYTRAVGLYAVSEALYDRSLAACLRVTGPDSESTLAVRHSRADLRRSQGDLALAETEHRALRHDLERTAADASRILDIRACLAEILHELGRSEEAEAELDDVVAERGRVLGPTALDTLEAKHRFGHLLWDRGRLTQAADEHREVLAASVAHRGDEDVYTQIVRVCHARVLQQLGRVDEAEAELRRACSAPESPLNARWFLSGLLRSRLRFEEAEVEHRGALDEFVRVLGDEHPQTLALRHDFGHLLEEKGSLPAAEAEHRQVVEAQVRLLGATHPNTLKTRHCRARILRKQERFDDAEAEFRAVLVAREGALGPDHHLVLSVRHQLGHLSEQRGDLAGAEDHHRVVIVGLTRALGARHPDTLDSRLCLGTLLHRQGRHAEAEAEFRAVSGLSARVHGAAHVNTLSSRYHLAAALSEQRRWGEAELELRAVLALAVRTLDEEHPFVAAVRDGLAALSG